MQQQPDSGQQFSQVDRLRQVIVGPSFKPLDDLLPLLDSGNQDHRNSSGGLLPLQGSADLKPVPPRHFDIQEHQIGLHLADPGQGLLPVCRFRGSTTLHSQIFPQGQSLVFFVLDDQNELSWI